MVGTSARRLGSTVVCGFVLLWELLYYVGVIDSSRFSHPLGTIDALRNLDLIIGLGKTLFYVVISSFLGVSIGLALAGFISQSSWLSQTVIRFLRLGLWAPFFVFWAVPYWLLPSAVSGVSLFACYQFLSIRLALSLPWRKAIVKVQRGAILQALLFYLLFQVFLPEGWTTLSLTEHRVDIVYAIIVLLLGFVFFLDRIFRANFPSVAAMRRTALMKEIDSNSMSSYWGSVILIVICLSAWQLFADQILRHFRVGSPLAVLGTVYPPLASGLLFFDIAVSLLEVFTGLVLGGGVAVVIFKGMSAKVHFKNLMFSVLPLTFIVPIMLRLVEFHWVELSNSPWRTALGVGLLTFYPLVLVLWGLRDHHWVCKILLAADDALPYTFLAMLFGETMSASKGLGFWIIVGRNTLSISQSLGTSLLAFALLIFLSSLLRSTAAHLILRQARAASPPIPSPATR